MERDEIEKRILDWNKKNNPPLREGYIKAHFSWHFQHKPILPPNCKQFYQGISVCQPDALCSKIKNPVNYVVRKNFMENRGKNKDNFKNKK